MAHITADRVRETTTTTGTGNLTLAGAESGYLAFSGRLANNDTCFYCVSHRTLNEFEVGLGTYVSATPALARTSVIASSNGDAAVNFSAGTKDVFITAPAIAQLTGVLSPTPGADQNDYNPTGFALANRLHIAPTVSMKLTGLAGGYNGRCVTIKNTSTDFLLWIENENTASAAANRFTLRNGFPLFLMPGDNVELCYNGATSRWEFDKASAAGVMGLQAFSDFSDGIGQGTAGGFAGTVAGTGASGQASTYLIDTTERPMGVIQFDTGTTATGRATLGGTGTGEIVPTLGAALHVARLAVETTVSGAETFQVLTGFIDSSGGTPTDGVCWTNRWTGAAAEWSQERYAAAAATRSNTGSPTPDNNYLWCVIFINPGWTRADFIFSTDSVAFSVASSPTTGFPSNAQPTTWCAVSIIKSVGTTQRNVSIDLAGYRVDYVRG